MFHRACDCPCLPASAEVDKTERIIPVPFLGFVVSRRVTGTLSWQSRRTLSQTILVHKISSVDMFSQTGAEALGTRIPSPSMRLGVADCGTLNTLRGRAGILVG